MQSTTVVLPYQTKAENALLGLPKLRFKRALKARKRHAIGPGGALLVIL